MKKQLNIYLVLILLILLLVILNFVIRTEIDTGYSENLDNQQETLVDDSAEQVCLLNGLCEVAFGENDLNCPSDCSEDALKKQEEELKQQSDRYTNGHFIMEFTCHDGYRSGGYPIKATQLLSTEDIEKCITGTDADAYSTAGEYAEDICSNRCSSYGKCGVSSKSFILCEDILGI